MNSEGQKHLMKIMVLRAAGMLKIEISASRRSAGVQIEFESRGQSLGADPPGRSSIENIYQVFD